MKWYIGQRIVAIKNHSAGRFKKGDDFTIEGLRSSACKCHNVDIHVGHSSVNPYSGCTTCKIYRQSDAYYWYAESCFAPIDELSDHTIESIIEELEIITVKPQTVEI